MGDNANIYRLVDTAARATATARSTTTTTRRDAKIVPRAAELLADYTPGGPDITGKTPATIGDIGAGDELHGESGDDFIYGMTGNDVMFGEGQDDDLVGGWGNDWISGGTGDDGVVGADGRIFTSRNGLDRAAERPHDREPSSTSRSRRRATCSRPRSTSRTC